MELEVRILNGARKGVFFALPDITEPLQGSMPWVLEDEAIIFRLIAPKRYNSAVLDIYQHSIVSTCINVLEDSESIEYIWEPQVGMYQSEKLFLNYFGTSELVVLLEDSHSTEVVRFQPLQVAAKESSAIMVEQMFEYLASISNEALYSVFSATRYSAGFEEGAVSPTYVFERIQHSIKVLQETLPLIFNKPLTRLVPEQKLVASSGSEELDDSSIGWLLENLSVLEPDENVDQAHIYYDGQHFRASTLRMSVLNESTDVYENRVIHGFVNLLLREAQQLAQRYQNEFNVRNKSDYLPNGYISFFEKVSKFKNQLIGTQLERVSFIVEPLKQLKALLDKLLPVTRLSSERPIFTEKVRNNPFYRDVFVEIIKWHERGMLDWSAYENLFAIESIPLLFESYCYFRVVESVNGILNNQRISENSYYLEVEFVDISGKEISIYREPDFWAPLHTSKNYHGLVNSEAYTVRNEYNFSPRGQKGAFSKRQPDIVIQFKKPEDGSIQLLVMDAKYTRSATAFARYLPELTMKYIHGIHRPGQEIPTVTSLSILFPHSSDTKFTSFHHGDMGLFGEYPVTPCMQTLGIILGIERDKDMLYKHIERLFEVNGIRTRF